MKFERLRLAGFKSFCDPTDFKIEAGLTGIVGPNGCGKSNIVDAIRWCMGEQSAKHLRGRSMEDVIFNGSDARKPTAAAEGRRPATRAPAGDPRWGWSPGPAHS